MSRNSLSALRLFFFIGLGFVFATATRADEFRTWTDATGRFKLQAKLVSVDEGDVTLVRENGKEMTIPLKKLSKKDQEYLAKLESDNPFQAAEDNPFSPAKPARATSPGRLREVTVDWSDSQGLLLNAAESEWKITPPVAPEAGFRNRSIALPNKRDFFEKLCGLAINPVAKKAVVGYSLKKRRGDESSTRLVLCDLERGRATATEALPGEMAPLALHDDGQQVLMRRNEFGHGKSNRLEIWAVQGKRVARTLAWTPYTDGWEPNNDVRWAEFIDAKTLATASSGGRVALWDAASAKPICHFETTKGVIPAVSPDRKWLAFCAGDQVGLFDLKNREVAVLRETPSKLSSPMMAFSPSGKRIGCVAGDRIFVWDTASGELENNFATPGIHIHGGCTFPHDDYILAGKSYLIALESQLKLWQYSGAEHVRSVGETTFFAVGGHREGGVLALAKVPHPEASSLLEKAIKQPDMFVFHEGSPVKLNVSGVPAAQRTRVTESLTKKLKEMKCSVDPAAPIEIAASVDGPKQREISYMHSGDYKVREYLVWIRFLYQGKTVWERSCSNVPGFIALERGENIEGVLRKAGQQPTYDFYDRVTLPEFLQKPSDGQNPNSGQTLGSCEVTRKGFR